MVMLQASRIPYTPLEECRNQYRKVYNRDIPKDSLCAGGDGVEACKGDDGAPLILKSTQWQSDVIVGIVSFGMPVCGTSLTSPSDYLPGVFVSIKAYESDIAWVLDEHSSLS